MHHEHLTATIVVGGDLWALKGNRSGPDAANDADRAASRVGIHGAVRQARPAHRLHARSASPSLPRTSAVVAERNNPRASFARHDMRTHWDPLHRAYFNGYALWTYLTTPFLLAADGFQLREIEPWREGAESLARTYERRFPP